jgi:hypothetical protein
MMVRGAMSRNMSVAHAAQEVLQHGTGATHSTSGHWRRQTMPYSTALNVAKDLL